MQHLNSACQYGRLYHYIESRYKLKKEQTKTENLHAGHRGRMKDQYMAIGLNSCSDLHLLEMLLFYAVPRVDTNVIAHRLLNKFKNINGILGASREDILSIQGIGENAWLLIKTISKISDTIVSGKEEIVDLTDKNALYDFFYSSSYSAVNEYMNVVFMNYRMEVISNFRYNCSDEGPFIPSKAFDYDFENGEKFCVCAHVKPKSDPVPDKDDLKLAYEIASELFKHSIELRDFLIIGKGEVRSAMNCRIVDP